MRNSSFLYSSCQVEADCRNGLDYAELVNISFNGFAARVDQYLPNGKNNLNMTLSDKSSNKSFCAKAEVVWMNRVNGSYVYGFKFTGIDKEQRTILSHYL